MLLTLLYRGVLRLTVFWKAFELNIHWFLLLLYFWYDGGRGHAGIYFDKAVVEKVYFKTFSTTQSYRHLKQAAFKKPFFVNLPPPPPPGCIRVNNECPACTLRCTEIQRNGLKFRSFSREWSLAAWILLSKTVKMIFSIRWKLKVCYHAYGMFFNVSVGIIIECM